MSAQQQQQLQKQPGKTSGWKVQASCGAMNTTNPIREIIETMNLAENPNKSVIPLSIGDPTIFGNLKPCEEILCALHKAFSCGKYYGYQTAAGMESARDAVVDYHFRCTGNKVRRQDVILASGCSHAIDLCICVLAKQGQNILIPRPGFPLYKTLTSVYGVQYKQYNLLPDQNWSIDLKHLESLIDENTAAIVINNPSNPCGSVFSREHLLQILELAETYRKPIIADEIYDKFVFQTERYKQQVISNGLSTLSTDCDNVENRQPIVDKATSENSISATTTNGDYSDYEDLDDYDDIINSNGNEVGNESVDFDFEPGNSSSSITRCAEIGNSCSPISDLEPETEYIPFIPLSSLSKTVPILTCGGISKTCLIPGLRLGWIIINDRQNIFDVSVRNGLNRLTQRLMGPNSLVQGALADILTKVPEEFYAKTMDFIYKNAKLCYKMLRTVRGLQPHMPQGSMYLMVRFDPKVFPNIDGDLDFTSKLMNEESVLVLPGRCFDFPNYFRICLTVPTPVMEEALGRMRAFCERNRVDMVEMAIDEPMVKVNGYVNESPMIKLNLRSTNINGKQTNRCK